MFIPVDYTAMFFYVYEKQSKIHQTSLLFIPFTWRKFDNDKYVSRVNSKTLQNLWK